MKVGILTFNCALNYGAVLQCHGLYSIIKSFGHDVQVIDYRPSYLYSPRPEIGKRKILFHPIVAYQLYQKTAYWRHNFNSFLKFQKRNWVLTTTVTNEIELRGIINIFDAVVVGSDQVWASAHNGHDPVWYGLPDTSPKWIAYAASAGDANVSTEDKKLLSTALNTFSAISVREKKLASILSSLLPDKTISTVLDPTLMSDISIWLQWMKPTIKEKYVTIYQARPDDNVFRIANDIATQMKINRIVVLDNHSNVVKNGFKPYPASPSEFVSIISNSKCVITTSFHGTAFSIITGVPFYTLFLNDGADERTKNLVELLCLEKRMIDKNDSPKYSPIDYSHAHNLLNNQRNYSKTFINKALYINY